jgi:hypothetical protein
MHEEWDEYVEESRTVDEECMRIYGLLFKMLEDMEQHEQKLEAHRRGTSGVVAIPAEGVVEFKVAISSIREAVSAIIENDDFPGVNLRACVADSDYGVVFKKYLPLPQTTADDKENVELNEEGGAGGKENNGSSANYM